MPTNKQNRALAPKSFTDKLRVENTIGGLVSSSSALSESVDELKQSTGVVDRTPSQIQDDNESVFDKVTDAVSWITPSTKNSLKVVDWLSGSRITLANDLDRTKVDTDNGDLKMLQNKSDAVDYIQNIAPLEPLWPEVLRQVNLWKNRPMSERKSEDVKTSAPEPISKKNPFSDLNKFVSSTYGRQTTTEKLLSEKKQIEDRNSPIDKNGNVKNWVSDQHKAEVLAGNYKPSDDNTLKGSNVYKYLSDYEKSVADQTKFPFVEFGGDLPGIGDMPPYLRAAYIKHSGALRYYEQARKQMGGKDAFKNTFENTVYNYTPDQSVNKQKQLPSTWDLEKHINEIDYGNSDSFNSYKKTAVDYSKRVNAEIVDYRKSLLARSQPSEYYKQKMEEGNLLYTTPGTIGSSSSEALSQWGSMAAEITIAAIPSILKMPSLQPIADIVAAGVNVMMNVHQRNKEDLAEVEQQGNTKIDNTIKAAYGKTIEDFTDQELLAKVPYDKSNLTFMANAKGEFKRDGKLSENTKYDLTRGIRNGTYKTNDPVINEAIKSERKGLQEYWDRDQAFMLGDIVTSASVAIPGASFIKSSFSRLAKNAVEETSERMVGKLLSGESRAVRGLKTITDATRMAYDKSLGRFSKSKAAPYLSLAAIHTINAGSEYLEEGGQYVNGQNYIYDNQVENTKYMNSLIDGYAGGLTGVAQVLGLSNDNRYINRDDFQRNAVPGFVLGMIMPLPFTAMHVNSKIQEQVKDKQARKFVESQILPSVKKDFIDGSIISDLDSNTRMIKSQAYVNSAIQGRGAHVISNIEKMIANPPEGTTREQLQEELEIAKETIGIAESKQVKKFAKTDADLEGTEQYGSNNHKLLVGLIMDHRRSRSLSETAVAETNSTVVNTERKDFAANPVLGEYFKTINAKRQEEGKPVIDTIQQIKLVGLDNRLNSIAIAIKTKNASNDNEKAQGVDGYLSDSSKHFMHELLQDQKSTAAQIFKIKSDYEITDEEYNDLPDAILSNDHNAALNKNVVAQAGIRYDSYMEAGLLGYKTKATNTGYSLEKMSDSSHENFVLKHLNKYKDSRDIETTNEDSRLQKEVDDANYEENHDNAESQGVSHPGERVEPSEKVAPEPIYTDDAANDLAMTFPPTDDTNPPVISETNEERESKFNQEAIDRETRRAGQEAQAEAFKIAQEKDKVQAKTLPSDDIKTPSEESNSEQSENTEAIDSEEQEILKGDIESLEQSMQDLIHSEEDVASPTQEEGSESVEVAEKKDEVKDIEEAGGFVSSFRVNRLFFGVMSDELAKSVRKLSTGGFKSSKQLGEMLRSENALSDCEFEIYVTPDNNGIFAIGSKSTYDYANILVKITKRSGDHSGDYLSVVRDPRVLLKDSDATPTGDDTTDLSKFRENIINLVPLTMTKSDGKTTKTRKIVATSIKLVDGIINTLRDKTNPIIHVQRKLEEIPGFNLPRLGDGKVNWNLVNTKTINLLYGGGETNYNDLLTPGGSASGFSTRETNAGNAYLLVPGNVSKSPKRVHVNMKQFSREDPSVVNFIIGLLTGDGRTYINTKGKLTDSGISAFDMINKIVNFGPTTEVGENRTAEQRIFLTPKQFYVDSKFGFIQLGENKMNLDELRTESGITKLREFVTSNLHWNLDKNDLVNTSENVIGEKDNKIKDLFPSLSRVFNDETNSITSATFAEGLTISKDDMELTWAAWLLKNGKITSDAIDDIFTPPFMHLEAFKVIDNEDNAIVSTNGGELLKTPPVNPQLLSSVIDSVSDKDIDVPIKKETGKTPTFADLKRKKRNLPKGPSALSILKEDIKERVNFAVESKWIVSKLGMEIEDIHELDRVLTLAGDRQAMGAMYEDSIAIWKGSEEGTGYHEAWHRISLLMFSRAERVKVYQIVRDSVKSMKNADSNSVEEYLAERFRQWKLDNESINDHYGIKRFFRIVANFTNKLLGLSPKSLDRLFKDVELGVFKGHSINQNSLREFKDKYGDAAPYGITELNLNNIQTYTQLFEIRDALLYTLFRVNGVSGIDKNVEDIDFGKLNATIKQSAEEETDPQRKALFEEIHDRFEEVFIPKLKRSLTLMGIREIDEYNATDTSSNQLADEMADHSKASYEISKKDNIRTGVKMFIATMEHSEIKDGELEFIEEPMTGLYKFIPFDVAWNTMISHLSNERTVESMIGKISRLSENNAFYRNLLERISELDEDGNPMLDENFKTQFWNTMFSLRHEFINIGYKEQLQSQNQVESLFNVMDSDVDRATKTLPLAWGQMLSEDENIYPTDANGQKTFNAKYVESIRTEFRDGISNPVNWSKNGIDIATEEGRRQVINKIVSLYSKLGVNIDSETIEYMLSSGNGGPENSIESLMDYLTNRKSGKMYLLFNNILKSLIDNDGSIYKKDRYTKINRKMSTKNIFLGEKFAKNLAAAYIKVHPSPEEVTVLGADGAKLYQISLNNYLSDKVRDINQSPEAIDELLKSTYNRGRLDQGGIGTGSRLLSQLRTGVASKIQLKTFVKLYEEETKDKGRDYLDISPAEDYVMKMAAMSKDYMCLPTMADKKTYMFISGIKLIHEGIIYNRTVVDNPDGTSNNVINIDFGPEAKDQLGEYFIAELYTIRDAWDEYQLQGGDQNKLEKVYHFGGENMNTGKKWSENHGNGLRFRHFGDMVHALSIGGEVKTSNLSLNDYLDAAVLADPKDGLTIALNNLERIFITNKDSDIEQGATTVRNDMINASLTTALYQELEYCKSIGVIQYDGSNTYTLNNKLLDKGDFNKHSSNAKNSVFSNTYGGYENQAATIQMIGEGLVNGIISVNEFEKIISKDPSFYPNPDSKIKRLSSILSTGSNLRTDWPVGHRLSGVTKFNSSELNDNKVGSNQFAELRNRFLASSINSELRKSLKQTIPNLLDLINNKFLPIAERDVGKLSELEELNKQYKKQFAIGSKSVENSFLGYGEKKINETDATVYISPSMYRNIVEMLGEWSPEMEDAFNLLESPDQSWMNDDVKYTSVMNLALKPLKMIYFGDRIDEIRNLDIPKLDKMAMFPLFRALAGGDLSTLYDRMNIDEVATGMRKIDMVAFNSAVKVGNGKTMSFYKDGTQSEINDLSNMAHEEQEYKYLRRQLLTDPHESANINLGTQANKTGLSNILSDKTYSNIDLNGKKGATGAELIAIARESNIALSDLGVNSLSKELGVTTNESGQQEVNEDDLYKLLSEDAENSGMSVDIIEKLSTKDGEKRYPLQGLLDWKWIESRIMATIGKKVIDVQTPGGMFIQMTPFGLKSIMSQQLNEGKISQEDYDKSHKGKHLINNGMPLRFFDDGSMETVISITMFKDVLPKEIKNFSAQKQWLIDNKIIGPNSQASSIGYRIPTQGLSSMSSLKIVDVMPANIGDTIVLPTEFTKLTGSDFDIDKLYIARYNFKKNESGVVEKMKFDDSLSIDGKDSYHSNSKEAVQNRLLDVFMAVLTDPDSTHETRMPLDTVTDELKDNILSDVESLINVSEKTSPFKYLSPSFQSRKKEEYSTGKRGIAPFALGNAHHVLTQTAKLEFNNRGPIRKFEMSSLHDIDGIDGKRILDWLSAMINAHVDVAKDPYITRLNVNQYTYNTVSLLLRTGIGGNSFYFMPQPILKEIANGVRLVDGQYGADKMASAFEKEERVVRSVSRKYMNMAKVAILAEGDVDERKQRLLDGLNKFDKNKHKILDNGHVFDKEYLRTQLASISGTFEHAYNQLLIFETYQELQPFSKSLAELVKYSQIDNKKWGNSLTSIKLFAKNVQAIKELGNKSVFRNVSQFYAETFLNAKLKNALSMSNLVGNGRFFRTTDSVENFINKIASRINSRNVMNEDTVVEIANAVDSLIKSKFYIDLAKENNTDIGGIFFGDNTIAKRLYKIKQKIKDEVSAYALLSNNTFLNNIEPEISEVNIDPYNQRPDHVYVTSSVKNDNYATEIKEYWGELLDSPIPEVKSFAHDFILYQYFSNGENGAFNQVKLGEDVRSDIGFGDFVNNKLEEFKKTQDPFENEQEAIDQVFRNRWYDDKIVPSTYIHKNLGTFTDIGGMRIPDTYNAPSIPSRAEYIKGKTHEVVFIQSDAKNIGMDDMKNPIFRPYVKVAYDAGSEGKFYVLYKQVGTVTDEDGKIKPVYTATDKSSEKVSGRSIVELGLDKSIVPSNTLRENGTIPNFLFTSNEMFTSAIQQLVAAYNNDPRFQSARVSKDSADAFSTFRPLDEQIEDGEVYEDQYDEDMMEANPIEDLRNQIKEYLEVAENTKDYESAANSLNDDLSEQGYSDAQIDASMYEFSRLLSNSQLTKNNTTEELKTSVEAYSKVVMDTLLDNNVSTDYFNEAVTTPTKVTTEAAPETLLTDMKDITNHSGGAIGADSMFDTIGREYGVINHIHYYHGSKTPLGNRVLTQSELEEGWSEVQKANTLLHRRPDAYKDLLSRNWFQVKNSTQVVAIAPIENNMKTVKGGTGWAVAMAQVNGKEVNVFNLTDNLWYKWNGDTFVKSATPILEKDFAGIGSRQDAGKMTLESIQAIRDVYENTKNSIENKPISSVSISEQELSTINKTFQDAGFPAMTMEEYNNLSDEDKDNLKPCFS